MTTKTPTQTPTQTPTAALLTIEGFTILLLAALKRAGIRPLAERPVRGRSWGKARPGRLDICNVGPGARSGVELGVGFSVTFGESPAGVEPTGLTFQTGEDQYCEVHTDYTLECWLPDVHVEPTAQVPDPEWRRVLNDKLAKVRGELGMTGEAV